jgi:hypothetical protein
MFGGSPQQPFGGGSPQQPFGVGSPQQARPPAGAFMKTVLLLAFFIASSAGALTTFEAQFRAAESCAQSNIVYTRADSADARHGAPLHNRTRPWSMHARTNSPTVNVCETEAGLLESLMLGKRRQTNACMQLEHGQQCLSVFEPFRCTYAWLSADEARAIMQRYSTAYFIGDSLTRHVARAFFALLSGNLEYGGLPPGMPTEVYDNCRCDGQFAEMLECRIDEGLIVPDNRQVKLCNSKTHFGMTLLDPGHGLFPEWLREIDFCADTRPTYVYISVGAHNGFNVTMSTAVVDSIMDVILANASLASTASFCSGVGLLRRAPGWTRCTPRSKKIIRDGSRTKLRAMCFLSTKLRLSTGGI